MFQKSGEQVKTWIGWSCQGAHAVSDSSSFTAKARSVTINAILCAPPSPRLYFLSAIYQHFFTTCLPPSLIEDMLTVGRLASLVTAAKKKISVCGFHGSHWLILSLVSSPVHYLCNCKTWNSDFGPDRFTSRSDWGLTVCAILHAETGAQQRLFPKCCWTT